MTTADREPWARNPLRTFDELLEHLGETASRLAADSTQGRALLLDAALTACALGQILDDFLHRGFLGIEAKLDIAVSRPKKLERFVEHLPRKAAAFVRRSVQAGPIRLPARVLDRTAAVRVALRSATREGGLLRASFELQGLAADLAEIWLRHPEGGGCEPRAAERVARLVAPPTRRSWPGALRRRVLKIPSCFKDFDCHPDDLGELVRRFAEAPHRAEGSVTAVGIRTSGSYLGPFCAAHLRTAGFEDAGAATIRQKVPLFRAERRRLVECARRGTLLLVDDPPVTGNAILAVVRTLERIGVPREHIVPLLLEDPSNPLFREEGEAALRELEALGAIRLPRAQWRIRREIEGEAILSGAGPLAEPARGDGADSSRRIEIRPLATRDGTNDPVDPATVGECRDSRCHEKARLVEIPRDASAARTVAAIKGCGWGWYEAHVRDAAEALEGFVPPWSIPSPGVLATRWVAGAPLSTGLRAIDEAVVRHVARYVAARARHLSIRSGIATDLVDRETGWHVLAQSFAQSYAFLAPFAYVRLRRRLSAIADGAPRAAIDGKMGPAEWILPAIDGSAPRKIDFEEHGFDRMDLAILDPAYDLACFVVEACLAAELEEVLVATYVEASGDRRAPARLPHYKLLAGLSRQAELRLLLAHGGSISRGFSGTFDRKGAAVARTETERGLTRTANGFLARAVGADEPPPAPARIFAVDLDGVLEDTTLGYNATTPAGARAILTLKRHGFHPVVCTGRSLAEVQDRARSFRLTAGIAEYGSVVWTEGASSIECLATAEERAQLERLRSILHARDDAIVDPAYAHSVRVLRYDGGSRRAFPAAAVADLLRDEGLDRLRIVAGDAQTDVVGASCDKGRGLRRLAEILEAREVHAVGDTLEDAAMFRAADRAWAPSNVRREALEASRGAAPRVGRRKLERGLLEAARLAAHGRDRGCARCRPGTPPPEHRALVQAFGIRDRSRLRKIVELVRAGALHHFRVSR